MVTFAPGNRRQTASAMTCEQECRIRLSGSSGTSPLGALRSAMMKGTKLRRRGQPQLRRAEGIQTEGILFWASEAGPAPAKRAVSSGKVPGCPGRRAQAGLHRRSEPGGAGGPEERSDEVPPIQL